MKDKSIISMNAENNHNSNSGKVGEEEEVHENLILREKIENSPFEIISFEKKHFIGLGNYRISEETTDKASLVKSIEDKDWDLLFNMMSVVADTIVNKMPKG